jgi:UDP-2,3-diacylglucosamine pyrophosphatase LpxH
VQKSPYAGWNHRTARVVELPSDVTVWFVSDLHIGDGTPSDAFFGKDAPFVALVERVAREDAHLCIVGDAIDFHQAWTLARILDAHPRLFHALSELAGKGRLIYVIGNHDYEIGIYEALLRLVVCDELRIGDDILVLHGWQFDPVLRDQVGLKHGWGTTVHHLVERWAGTWIRIPLGEFYTRTNRLFFWLGHKVWWASRLGARLFGRDVTAIDEAANYWCWGNLGDAMGMFRPVRAMLQSGPWKAIVCGHSHLPGLVPIEGRTYVNTGSWTFASSQYAVWDGSAFRVADWRTGRRYGAELYERMLDGSLYERDFHRWWRDNYLGWFRFREGEERRGTPRAWELLVRDAQMPSGIDGRTPRPPR